MDKIVRTIIQEKKLKKRPIATAKASRQAYVAGH
jgi:hypothetical protein